jgi:hypothetical protein
MIVGRPRSWKNIPMQDVVMLGKTLGDIKKAQENFF